MALADIKDAGILAGFTRWGWPWHGIIKSGMVGATGQPHQQPLDNIGNGNNFGWLIDYGMPAVSLTSDEQTFYSGLNMEWRNYGLIPGGYVYGTYIGDETFIYIDGKGDAWMIALAYAFPGGNVCRITATLTRFGLLYVDGSYTPPSPITQIIDVACACIELSPAPPGASGAYPYLSQYGQIQDVHTNGSKVLIGVFLRAAYGTDSNGFALYNDDMFSLIELVPSGEGLSISISASEIKAQSSLTTGGSSSQTLVPGVGFQQKLTFNNNISSVCPSGTDSSITTFTAALIAGTYVPPDYASNYQLGSFFTRYAYYDAAGIAHVIQISQSYTETALQSIVTELYISGGPTTASYTCAQIGVGGGGGIGAPTQGIGIGGVDCPDPATETRGIFRLVSSKESSYTLFDNGAVIDQIGWQLTTTTDTEYVDVISTGSHATNVTTTDVLTKYGGLNGYIADSSGSYPFPQLDHGEVITNAFRSYRQSFYSSTAFTGSTRFIGMHKMSSKAVAFYGGDTSISASTYGLASTPIGNLVVGITPAISVNFAYQRKTGSYSFDTSPICYV